MPPKKKLVKTFTLQLPAGQATPAPPVGPALGQHGVNIMEFVKRYNAETESQRGDIVPAQISVYEDRSFTFILKTPPAALMSSRAAGGVFSTNVNVRSSYTLICAGTMSPRCDSVWALYALTNSMMFTPC